MTPPQPNSIDPRAEIEAIFALENKEHVASEYVATHSARRTKRSFTPHIATGAATELELIERAKAHAPSPERSKYEHLEQIAVIGLYLGHLRDGVLAETHR